MGHAGDLLLIFADALARSWKQITKFKSSGTAPDHAAKYTATASSHLAAIATTPPHANGADAASPSNGADANTGMHHYLSAPTPAEPVATLGLEGIIRDERGIRMAPASDD